MVKVSGALADLMHKVFRLDNERSGGTSSRLVWINHTNVWRIEVYPPFFHDGAMVSLPMVFYKQDKLVGYGSYDMLTTDELNIKRDLPNYVYRAASVIVRRMMANRDYWFRTKVQTEINPHLDYTEHTIMPEDSRPHAPCGAGSSTGCLFGTAQHWVVDYQFKTS